ncbi:MAG: HAD family hydrolase [Alphaproteobacteria bacterium]|nr:MAG: HAD family hydrolase [Alphaproteobacteria bacterium]
MIKAVTFDLWDTMIHDDSDEATRKAQGLRSKRAERRHLLWEALNAAEPIGAERVNLAYDVADAAFNRVWHDLFVTWTIEERLRVVLEGIGRALPEAAFAKVVAAHESMEVEIPPDTIDGIEVALADLAQRYKLCVVSDTIVTPGRGLRDLLEGHGLKQYFSGFAFSDEIGHSKPHRAMFDAAADQLDVAMEEMVHIGDRDHNDVKGSQVLGMKAVLFVATRAHDKDQTSADAICARHAELPGIVDRLAAG